MNTISEDGDIENVKSSGKLVGGAVNIDWYHTTWFCEPVWRKLYCLQVIQVIKAKS